MIRSEALQTNPPGWDLSLVYNSVDDPSIKSHMRAGEAVASRLAPDPSGSWPSIGDDLSALEACSHAMQSVLEVVQYGSLRTSLDAQDEEGEQLVRRATDLLARLQANRVPIVLRLARLDETDWQKLIHLPEAVPFLPELRDMRRRLPYLLDSATEAFLKKAAAPAAGEWGILYTKTMAALRIELEGTSIGFSQLPGLLASPERGKREAGFRAGQAALAGAAPRLAAGLNNILQWHLSVARLRDPTGNRGPFQEALEANQLDPEVFDAFWSVVQSKGLECGREALCASAQELGLEHMSAWDLAAPEPGSVKDEDPAIPFGTAAEWIREAFAALDDRCTAFIDKTLHDGWIEARVDPRKRSGAFCSSLSLRRESRVFMTYEGKPKDVLTLAHELGHAYHNWLLRDEPFPVRSYTMSTAETASTFAECLLTTWVRRNLPGSAADRAMRWTHRGRLATFLVDIPTRVLMEQRFFDERQKGPLSAQRFGEITDACFSETYGKTLEESDSQFWASKLHFHMADRRFYNFPYTFGYLFSSGLFARFNASLEPGSMGSDAFSSAYQGLLRDTGRLWARELVLKHFGVDIADENFWKEAVKSAHV